MRFINRENELKFLNEKWQRNVLLLMVFLVNKLLSNVCIIY